MCDLETDLREVEEIEPLYSVSQVNHYLGYGYRLLQIMSVAQAEPFPFDGTDNPARYYVRRGVKYILARMKGTEKVGRLERPPREDQESTGGD